MIRLRWATYALAGVIAAACSAGAAVAQTKIKLATYVPAQHDGSKVFEGYLKEVAARSKGAIEIDYYPGAQLGPPPKYYDMAVSGQADVTQFLHGNTPGLFPLSEVGTVPLLFGSAEIGTKVMNDPEILKRVRAEHKGVHILQLHTHQPANVFLGRDPIRTIEQFKGKRLRVPSGPIRDLAVALGATPDGTTPTEWAESLQKGTLAGVFTDYGGAGVAFHIGPVVKYATELYVYAGTFCVCMNRKTYDGLPAAVRKDLDETVAKKAVDVGKAFDHLDDVGKGIMMKEGTQPIVLAPEEKAKILKVAAKVTETTLDSLEKKKLPAREIYGVMKQLAAKHEATSRNFWK